MFEPTTSRVHGEHSAVHAANVDCKQFSFKFSAFPGHIVKFLTIEFFYSYMKDIWESYRKFLSKIRSFDVEKVEELKGIYIICIFL